jgi:hypothetical protein
LEDISKAFFRKGMAKILYVSDEKLYFYWWDKIIVI